MADVNCYWTNTGTFQNTFNDVWERFITPVGASHPAAELVRCIFRVYWDWKKNNWLNDKTKEVTYIIEHKDILLKFYRGSTHSLEVALTSLRNLQEAIKLCFTTEGRKQRAIELYERNLITKTQLNAVFNEDVNIAYYEEERLLVQTFTEPVLERVLDAALQYCQTVL